MRKTTVWRNLVQKVAGVVRVMPLLKLQTIGPERLDFLNENIETGKTIELRPGVAYCLRKFHPMSSDFVRGVCVRYVRQQNLDFLGETTDLNEFLFGSERAGLAVVRLADSGCNSKKRDRPPECEHLESWTERNTRFGVQIRKALEERAMISELAASNRVAHWAYAQTEAANGVTWLKADELVPVGAELRRFFL